MKQWVAMGKLKEIVTLDLVVCPTAALLSLARARAQKRVRRGGVKSRFFLIRVKSRFHDFIHALDNTGKTFNIPESKTHRMMIP